MGAGGRGSETLGMGHSFGHLFDHSLVCSFVSLFVCLVARPFICSFVRLFVHLFIRSFVRSFAQMDGNSLMCFIGRRPLRVRCPKKAKDRFILVFSLETRFCGSPEIEDR